MNITIMALTALSFSVLASGCAVQPLPAISGPSAQLEILTAALKKRGGIYPDEKVQFVAFQASDGKRLGGEELTIEHSKKTIQLPSEVSLRIRFFKTTAMFGTMGLCAGDYTTQLVTAKRYRATFNYDFDYDSPTTSTCAGMIEEFDESDQIIVSVAFPVTMKVNNVEIPLLILPVKK